ncbi:hypothetical protein CC80DRAFT_517786 [Byssothecium circinans]|uniref:HRDC domain-containing protein n=1 Tax=Byssothecium circinans TaxID=147558 RepID=A0A6A5TRD1_9PLEO|nr:hypothetical protein CC80DRAFT_517786 [Byssothecium circinans]
MQNPPKHPNGGPAKWWSHNLYRGPDDKKIEILYSKDKEHSETYAKMFLDEPVVGFDMEWPWNSDNCLRLQENIGLIQIACESKIALFHIGLHTGTTCEDIIAPSLRKLLESPNIAKAGVNVLNADFRRLKKYFGLNPQGALELSHLHRLVKHSTKPGALSTKLVALADQVKEHLDLPLSKGSVRTSNWRSHLNQQQRDYAAGDAYAGFMLFHCMNAKRAAMDPVPPLPIFADKYPPNGGQRGLRLHPVVEGCDPIMAEAFFRQSVQEKNTEENLEDESKVPDLAISEASKTQNVQKEGKKKVRTGPTNKVTEPMDAKTNALYDQLVERRKVLSSAMGMPPYIVANNAVLEGLARRRPVKHDELLEVKGIGKRTQEQYGAEWLEVIAQFLASYIVAPNSVLSNVQQPTTPTHNPRRRKLETKDSPDSSPAFGSPIQRTPQLHTGLSFGLAQTSLDAGDVMANGPPSPTIYASSHPEPAPHIAIQDRINALQQQRARENLGMPAQQPTDVTDSDSDDSAAFATPPSRPGSELKRKRSITELEEKKAVPFALAQPPPLSPQSKIFRNKLVAFSKRVTCKLPKQISHALPIVSDLTLDCIARCAPRTEEDLNRIPGIEGFVDACKATDTDLLKNIIKFAPAKL